MNFNKLLNEPCVDVANRDPKNLETQIRKNHADALVKHIESSFSASSFLLWERGKSDHWGGDLVSDQQVFMS